MSTDLSSTGPERISALLLFPETVKEANQYNDRVGWEERLFGDALDLSLFLQTSSSLYPECEGPLKTLQGESVSDCARMGESQIRANEQTPSKT